MPGVFRQFDFESEVCAFRVEGDNGPRRNQRGLERNVRRGGRQRVTRAPDLRAVLRKSWRFVRAIVSSRRSKLKQSLRHEVSVKQQPFTAMLSPG
jgi:hypothetical protein